MSNSRPDDSNDAPPAARRMLDRYELIAEIAKGGMGTVYLARLRSVGGFQRFFAIKLLHPHLAEQEHFVAMLLDEARLAARLHHPNAVGITDVCNSDLGYYLVMEYVDGFTLEDVLERAEERGSDERIRLGLRILLDASVGLEAAHRLKGEDGQRIGLVHRDVSPQNILVGTDGVGRITDFGVARAAARITLSQPGMIKGKPCYMAPEQATGGELDARADVFALGIILWETLTGRQLFESESGAAGVLYNVIHEEIALPSAHNADVGAELDAGCMKALDRSIEGRYQSSRELVRALESAAQGAGLLASTHAVSDAIETLFAEDLAQRETAIRLHLEALDGRPSVAALKSDIYHVPRLQNAPDAQDYQPTLAGGAKAREEAGPWHEGSDEGEAAEAMTSGEIPSRRAKSPDAIVAPADSSLNPAAAVDDPERARQKTMRLAIGLTSLGLVLLVVAITLVLNRPFAEPAAAAPGAPTLAASASASPPEEVVAPEEPAAEPPGGPTAAQNEPAEPGEFAEATEAPEPTESSTPEARRPAATPMARSRARRRAQPTRRDEAASPPPQNQPVFEDNPYIRR